MIIEGLLEKSEMRIPLVLLRECQVQVSLSGEFHTRKMGFTIRQKRFLLFRQRLYSEHLKDFFYFKWFLLNKLTWAPDTCPRIFLFWFRIRRGIRLFMHSAYSRIRTDSFRLFSVYEQIHFAYSQYTNGQGSVYWKISLSWGKK
jgi:hypothetical protein